MKYYLNTNGNLYENAWLIAVDMVDQCTVENFINQYRLFLSFIVKSFNLYFGVIVYRESKFGFGRVERYKGLSSEIEKISRKNTPREHIIAGDEQDEYMYAIIELDPQEIETLIYNEHYSIMFLATKKELENVIFNISKLKTPDKLKKYMLDSGIILTKGYCVYETPNNLEVAAWLISAPEKMKSFWYQFQDMIKAYDSDALFEECDI